MFCMRAFCRFSHHVVYDIIVIAVEFLLSVSPRSYFLLFRFPIACPCLPTHVHSAHTVAELFL